jgi:hypothetical protein
VLLLLTGTVQVLCQKLDPPPVPPLPAPQVEPPKVVTSGIRLPVSANVPNLNVVENEVCDFYKGHVTQIEIFPPIQANADFEIWRDKPLDIRLSGNTLTAKMHAYYWILGEVWVLGIPIAGQCGAQGPSPLFGDEETREVNVTANSRVRWHPQWHITTQTTIEPFQNVNRCVVTNANKDITDHFNKAGEGFLRGAAAKFDQRIAEITNFKDKASEMWSKLQEPISIGNRAWLMVQPEKAGAGEINVTAGTPQTAETVFGLTSQPKVVFGDQPSGTAIPLPPLEPLTPGPNGFDVNTDVEMTFEEANRILQDPGTGVMGATFTSGRRELKIVGARVYGTGPRLAVELEVVGRAIRGDEPPVEDVVTAIKVAYNRVRYFFEKKFYKLKGKVYLVGTPQYLTDRREIVFPDLEYDIQTRNVIVKIANWILKTRLTEQLRANVKMPLGDKLDSVKNRLSAGLNRELGPNARLSGNVESLTVERVYLSDAALQGRVNLRGNAAVSGQWK